MELFNNREIASIIWILIIAGYITFSPKVSEAKHSFKPVLKSFFVWKIQISILVMLLYITGIVYFLSELGLWEVKQLKNTVIWTVSVAFLSLFQVQKIKEDRNFFKHSVLDYLKLITFIEFFIGRYAFPLVVEFILLPTLTFFVIASEVAGRDEKAHKVKKYIDNMLLVAGVILFMCAAYMLFSGLGKFVLDDTIADFITPPLLTLFYLPFIFFFMIYVTYENVLIRLEYSIKKGKQRLFATLLSVIMFNVRIELFERWSSSLPNVETNSYQEIWKSILKILRLNKYEKNTQPVDSEYGWCPYKAKEALTAHDISTDYYHLSYDKWFASSRLLEIGEGILPNNIAFYIEGDEKVAKKLTLKLNINEPSDSKLAHNKFIEVVTTLYEFAISSDIPQWLVYTLDNKSSIERTVGFVDISITLEKFNNKDVNGYSLKLIFSNNS